MQFAWTESIMFEDWEASYIAAMLETDPKKLADKIDEATVVLRARLSEINSSPEYGRERVRIEDGLRTLDTVRRLELQIMV